VFALAVLAISSWVNVTCGNRHKISTGISDGYGSCNTDEQSTRRSLAKPINVDESDDTIAEVT
jgi:hypothetical protein